MFLYLAAMAGLLAFSAFFSGSETALFSLSRARARRMASGTPGERTAAALLRHPQHMLSTIVVGNMIVNVMLASLVAQLTQAQFGQGAAGAAICISTILLLVFGEVTPKAIAVHHSYVIARTVSIPLRILGGLFSPARLCLRLATNLVLSLFGQKPMTAWESLTKEEISAMLAMGEAEGVTTQRERAMISNILNLGSIEAHDLMVPRTEVIGIPDSMTLGQAFALACRYRHSRYPVYTEDLDDSWGIFSVIDMPHCRDQELRKQPLSAFREAIAGDRRDDKLPIYRAYLFPETARVEGLLTHMREKQVSMVVLVDEYGGTAGILTLDDILAEIVGQITPAGAAEKAGVVFAEDHLLVEGRTHLRELEAFVDIDFPENGADTIGGYVMELLARLPRAGDVVEDRHYRYQVIKMAGRRVGTLRMEKIVSPYDLEEGE